MYTDKGIKGDLYVLSKDNREVRFAGVKACRGAVRLVRALNILRLFLSSYSVLIASANKAGVGTNYNMLFSLIKRPSIKAASLASSL